MIIFFGDSITRDWPIHEVVETEHVNAGIGGETTGQMCLRFERDVLRPRPAVVHLLGGINDVAENQGPVSTEEITANLRAMVETARAHGIAVVLGLLLPCTVIAKRPVLRPRAGVLRLNDWIRTAFDPSEATLADYFTPLAGEGDALRADCTADGLHPNVLGYALMGPVARAALVSARHGTPA